MISKLIRFLKYTAPLFVQHPLWRANRLAPFLRFAKLQFSFATGHNQVNIRWIENLILPIKQGDTGLTGNYYLGLHEFEDMAFAIHILRENDSFVDVGANLGSYSLLASGASKALSFAYEPVPSTYSKLKQNIIINSLSNKVSTSMIAITSPINVASGKPIRFSTDKGAMNAFVDHEYTGSTIEVAISTLDRECKDIDPILLKIDVEGHELDLLQGAQEVLNKTSLLAVIIEGQTDDVNRTFREAGFVDISYDPLTRTLRPHSGTGSNRIWIKSEMIDEVSNRLKSAKKLSIYGASF